MPKWLKGQGRLGNPSNLSTRDPVLAGRLFFFFFVLYYCGWQMWSHTLVYLDLQTGVLHAEISLCDLNPELSMQSMAQKMLSEAADALSPTDRKELSHLVQQAKVAKPLWDGQPIQNRPSPSGAQAVDEGDNAPASWDHDKDSTMPAQSQSQVQKKSVPRMSSQSQDTGAVSASLHGTVSRGNSLDDAQSGSIPSQAFTAAAGSTTAAELEAKMAKIKEKIAAKRAAAAAKARNTMPASGNTSAINRDTAPEVSATAQANQMPLQSCSVAAAASNSGAMEVEPARVSGAVVSSATSAGKRPSQTSDKTCRHPPSFPLPMPDSSQSQRASTASSHSALPGDSKDGFQAAAQAYANTARLQACHAGRDLPAAPDATSINVCHESAQGCFSEQPAGPHSAPPQASSPLVGQMQSEQEAQISQPHQAHFDPHSWDFVQTQQGSIQDASICPSADAKASDSKPLEGANTLLMSSTAEPQQGLLCHYNQPHQGSHAAAAVAATARRMQILNRHAPHVLQHTAHKDINSNLKSAVPVSAAPPNGSSTSSFSYLSVNPAVAQAPFASAQPIYVAAASSPSQHSGIVAADQNENECMVPMEVDASLLTTQMQPSGTSFGDPPRAAFGHPYHQALQLHEACTCVVTTPMSASLAEAIPAGFVTNSANDHCSDMDIDVHV